MKIIEHTYCKRENCNLIGKEALVEETIPAVIDDKIGGVISPKWFWARVGKILHRFEEGDLE